MRSERQLLMIPGPTNVEPAVMRALSRTTISHVSQAFAEVFQGVLSDLAQIFMTKGDVFVIAGSGTLASEIAVANIVEAGDRVLVVCNGFFGDRLVEVAGRQGAIVERLEVPWGKAADPHAVEERLKEGAFKAVLAVHAETSTGAANPIREIGEVARRWDALYVVDTVCSLGGMEVRTDDWNIDVCFTASQKALATPPGLAILAMSPRALEARRQRKSRASFYYGDVENWLPVMKDPSKYFATPPVNMIYALHESCRAILEETLPRRFERHAVLASAFRAAMKAIGLQILAEEGKEANTLTVTLYPAGVEDAAFRARVATEYGITVAGALGAFKGKAFRVGHMGVVTASDIASTVAAIEGAMRTSRYEFQHGAGCAAANEIISRSKLT